MDYIVSDALEFQKIYSKLFEKPIKISGNNGNSVYSDHMDVYFGVKKLSNPDMDELVRDVVSSIAPFVFEKNSVSIQCGHYLGNGLYDPEFGAAEKPDMVSQKTFEAAVLADKILPNKNKFFSYQINNLGVPKEKRRPAIDLCAPFPETYHNIIRNELGKDPLLVRPSEYLDYYIHRRKINEIDANTKKIVLVEYESTLRNRAERLLEREMGANRVVQSGDILILNSDTTGQSLEIGKVTEGGVCDITPICRTMQVTRLIGEQELGVNTSININNLDMFKCSGKYANQHIALAPKPMNIINSYFKDNEVLVSYFLYPDLQSPEIAKKIIDGSV